MKKIIILSALLLSPSLFANNCKYFKEQFFGNFSVYNYNCLSNTENEHFSCYSANDPQASVSTVQISPISLGMGIALSVKQLDQSFNIVDERFLSEFNLGKNEAIVCSEIEENGEKVQFLKQQLTGLGESKIYTMLSKRKNVIELEMFVSLGGVITKQAFQLKLDL